MSTLHRTQAEPSPRQDALKIYQDHLDFLTSHLMRNDFSGFMTRISLPHSVTNLDREIISETDADIRKLFDEVHQSVTKDAITNFIRIALKADYVCESVIIGQHRSEMLRGATRAILPYLNRVRLERGSDNIWRETHCTNGIQMKSGKFALVDSAAEHGHPPRIPSHDDAPHQP